MQNSLTPVRQCKHKKMGSLRVEDWSHLSFFMMTVCFFLNSFNSSDNRILGPALTQIVFIATTNRCSLMCFVRKWCHLWSWTVSKTLDLRRNTPKFNVYVLNRKKEKKDQIGSKYKSISQRYSHCGCFPCRDWEISSCCWRLISVFQRPLYNMIYIELTVLQIKVCLQVWEK